MDRNDSPRSLLVERASEILERGAILHLGADRLRVSSQTGKYCDVIFLDAWRCTCPYHSSGRGGCKHITVLQGLVINVPKLKPADHAAEEPDATCTEYGSANIRCFETRDMLWGESKRYKCREYGKRFTHAPGILGRCCPMGVVTDAMMEDVVTGKSLNAASRRLKKRAAVGGGDDRAPDPSTVWRWVKHAADKIGDVAKKLPVRTGSKLHVDEPLFKSAGRGRSDGGSGIPFLQ